MISLWSLSKPVTAFHYCLKQQSAAGNSKQLTAEHKIIYQIMLQGYVSPRVGCTYPPWVQDRDISEPALGSRSGHLGCTRDACLIGQKRPTIQWGKRTPKTGTLGGTSGPFRRPAEFFLTLKKQ